MVSRIDRARNDCPEPVVADGDGSRRPVTIRDVARRAGVSTATVSRVISSPDRVTERTRAHVLAAIAETGYTPNASARNLRARSTKIILCLLPGLGNSFWNLILNTVEDILTQAGYGVILGDTRTDPVREAHYDRIVRAGQVDGVLLFNGRLPGEDFAKLDRDVPVVLVSIDIPGSGLPIIEIANRDSARAMTQYLIEMGHRRIAHITGPEKNLETHERVAGYRAALAEAGLATEKALIWPGGFTFTAGQNAARRYFALSAADRPTAVFAASDEVAIGFMRVVRDAGLRVPDDISVAGFDGVEYAALSNPSLTTMVQPRAEMGRLAAEHLIDRLNRLAPPDTLHIRLPCTLAIGESVAKPSIKHVRSGRRR